MPGGSPAFYIERKDILITRAEKKDAPILAELAVEMWDGHTLADLANEFEELAEREDAACFIKYEKGEPIGFAQCQLRLDYVEGTETSPVGYLEGIFIREEFRNRGFAGELLKECERWAKEKKCTEFASDCELGNEDSLKFHLAMGFEEANRIICFRKGI